MPRLFFPEGVGNIQRLQVRYASECKVPNEKRKVWRGILSKTFGARKVTEKNALIMKKCFQFQKFSIKYIQYI